MTSRERVLNILNHKEADQIPLDLGTGKACSINMKIYARLLEYFGIKEEIQCANKTSQLAHASEAFLERIGGDMRAPFPLFKKPPKPTSEEWEDENGYYIRNAWGTLMRMPKEGGLYYDMIQAPLQGTDEDDGIEYTLPELPEVDPAAVEQAKRFRQEGFPVLGTEHFGYGFLQNGPRIYGYEDWMVMLALGDKRVAEHCDKLLEAKMKYWDHIIEAFGDLLDVVSETDDIGMQSGPFISPELFRRVIKPYQKKLYDHIHSRTNAKIFLHTCGSIVELLPDLIEIGLDIVNPVQISAAGMDPAFLKKEFGKDIVFWGGGVDTQKVLPTGTQQQVRDQVKKNMEIFSKDGGFVFAVVHNLQADVPTENVIALLEAFHENKKYNN